MGVRAGVQLFRRIRQHFRCTVDVLESMLLLQGEVVHISLLWVHVVDYFLVGKHDELIHSSLHYTFLSLYLITLNHNMNLEGKPISLVSQRSDGELELNPEAVALLLPHENSCFVSVCGDYRSGKSFLLNSLFPTTGFQVSGSTGSCTKGIRMWTQPIPFKGASVWIIDTEGFGSCEQDSSYDGKIFLVTVLLSNVVLYNSVGAIDEQSVQKLAHICSEAQQLNNCETKLYWILRDFSLQMQSKSGVAITPSEYLQLSLQKTPIIRKTFPSRQCVALVRPLIDEYKLSILHTLPPNELRGDYLSSIELLKKSVLGSVTVGKSINGHSLRLPTLLSLVRECLGLINTGQIDTQLACTYERVMQHQRNQQFDAIVASLQKECSSLQARIPHSVHQMGLLTNQLHAQAEREMEERGARGLRERVMEEVGRQVGRLDEANRDWLREDMRRHVAQEVGKLWDMMSTLSMDVFVRKYQESVSSLRESYRERYSRMSQQYGSVWEEVVEREGHKQFVQLAAKWDRVTSDKYEALKRAKKAMEDECRRRLEDETRKLREDLKRGQSRVAQRVEEERLRHKGEMDSADEKHCEEKARQEEVRKELGKCEEELSRCRLRVGQLERQCGEITSRYRFEKRESEEQLAREGQKARLAEQMRLASEKLLEQSRMQSEQRIRTLREELQTVIAEERRKFARLTEDRKIEQSQLLEDIAQKNEKILSMRMELVQVDEKYKQELERILQQEKEILCGSIGAKMEQEQHRARMLQSRLDEQVQYLQEIQQYNRRLLADAQQQHLRSEEQAQLLLALKQRNNELCLEIERVGAKEQSAADEMGQLQKANAHLKRMLQEGQRLYELGAQEIIAEREAQSNAFTAELHGVKVAHAEALSKQTLKHAAECEALRDTADQLNAQLILLSDDSRRLASLTRILKEMADKDEQNDIEEIVGTVCNELKALRQQQLDVKYSLQSNLKELQHAEQTVIGIKAESKTLKREVETLRAAELESRREAGECRQAHEKEQKEVMQLRKEIQLHDQVYRKREESIKDNIQMYKSTIQHLVDQNALLAQQSLALRGKLEDLQQQLSKYPAVTQAAEQRAKDLEAEIRRLSKRPQAQEKWQMPERNFSKVLHDSRLGQVEVLKKENAALRRRFDQMREKEVSEVEQKRSYRLKLQQMEEGKYQLIKQELETYKKRTKEQIAELERKWETQREEKTGYRKQLAAVKEDGHRESNAAMQIMQQELQNEKKERIRVLDHHRKALAVANQTNQLKLSELDRKIGEIGAEREALKADLQASHAKCHALMRANAELTREIESIKGRATKDSLKEKYKEKLASLLTQ